MTTWVLIETPGEVNRFLAALVGGKLLAAAELGGMRGNTVDASALGLPGSRYGLGLVGMPLSCGVTAWGHAGDWFGFQTRAVATDDGRAVTIAATEMAGSGEAAGIRAAVDRQVRLIDAALCRPRRPD